jgi:hypothetical protein
MVRRLDRKSSVRITKSVLFLGGVGGCGRLLSWLGGWRDSRRLFVGITSCDVDNGAHAVGRSVLPELWCYVLI